MEIYSRRFNEAIINLNLFIIHSNTEACEIKIKNSLEGIVIKWHSAIDNVLKSSSATLFERNSHPMPMQEIKFWEARRANIKSIYDQLTDPRVKTIGNILELIDSVYTEAFGSTFKNIVTALHEADDITLWMTPLKFHFDKIEKEEFLENQPKKVDDLYHVVCLMWAHSNYYGTNKRMIVLFRMINNMYIECSSKFLDPGSLFQGEPDESLNVLNKIISVLEHHRNGFKIYRDKLPDFALQGKVCIMWTFDPKDIFSRYDLYMKRLYKIREIFETAYEFYKSEKMELGGVRGRYLSRCIQEINVEFKILYTKWTQIQFDPLDPDPSKKNFDRERRAFERDAEVLERKMAAIVVQAFDECFTLESFIKFLEICSSLLLRPLIYNEIKFKLKRFMDLYNEDLDRVKELLDKMIEKLGSDGVNALEIDIGFPPYTGAMVLVQRMRSRISRPQDEFSNIELKSIFESEDGKITQERYLELMGYLELLEKDIYFNWEKKVPGEISRGMDKFLLVKKEDGFLEVNFDIELVTALKEIRNLRAMGRTNLPDIANELHEHADDLWVSIKILLHIQHIVLHFFHPTTESSRDVNKNRRMV